MIEGWGLYTEQLMADVGYYDDAARLAQLAMRLLRALRIVLDMELQSGELTYEAAVARAVSVARLEESTARSEVARYTMTPTQPFSYLVGCLELERLRDASQARLGDAFACAASTTGSSPTATCPRPWSPGPSPPPTSVSNAAAPTTAEMAPAPN